MAKNFRTNVDVNGAFTSYSASVMSTSSANVPVVLKGAASQDTAILNVLDSSNNVLASIGTTSKISNAGSNTGLMSIGALAVGTTNTYGGKSSINTVANGNIGLVIRSAGAGQTADLQQWQNSSASVLASVSKDGLIYASSASISGNLTASTGTSTLGVSKFIRSSGDSSITIDAASGNYRLIWFTSSNLSRWSIFAGNVSETGYNVGSDFNISRYNDAGTYIDTPFAIARNTGTILLSGNLTASVGTTTLGNTSFRTSGNGISIYSSGSIEGGQINLYGGTSYSSSVIQIDNYAGDMRILYNNGNSLAATVSNTTGTLTLSTALTASAATTTLGTTNTGALTSTGSIVATAFHANANNTGQNFRVGDDVWIGDINVADTMSIRGLSGASSNGYIRFGSDSKNFGYNGSILSYGGNEVATYDRIRASLSQTTTTLDVPSRATTGNTALGASSVYWTMFTPMETITAASITAYTSTTQAAGTTVARMGLYSFDGTTLTLLARTSNDTTLFNAANTAFTRVFDTTGGYPSTVTLTAGTRYAAAVIVIATTMPTVATVTANALTLAATPRLMAGRGSQSDLPTTNTTLTSAAFMPVFRISS